MSDQYTRDLLSQFETLEMRTAVRTINRMLREEA